MENKEKIELVVFDWAGTTVDYGSGAPSEVFGKVFRAAGIDFTKEEIDGPMGLEKKAHIRRLLSTESGSRQWTEKYGRPWNEDDVDNLYENFEAALHEVVAERSDPLEGVPETVARLRKAGLKIGSTTGYNDWMMEQVRPRAAAGGYEPDCVVTPDTTGDYDIDGVCSTYILLKGFHRAAGNLRMHAPAPCLPGLPRSQGRRYCR